MSARDELRITADAEMVDHGERVGGEAGPLVPMGRGVGRVAVAVTTEVERPDPPPGRREPLRDGRPDVPVKAGRVGEERGRSVTAPVVNHEAAGGSVDRDGARGRRHGHASSQSRYGHAS